MHNDPNAKQSFVEDSIISLEFRIDKAGEYVIDNFKNSIVLREISINRNKTGRLPSPDLSMHD